MIYDAIVIGAGIEGSSTAYYLIANGKKKSVLLLEQVEMQLIVVHYYFNILKPLKVLVYKSYIIMFCSNLEFGQTYID